MAISREMAEELAELLPASLVCTDSRTRLLCVYELVRRLTDAKHRLSNADIRLIMEVRFGKQKTPAENTLAADLRSIAEASMPGCELHITPSGVWFENSQLTPANIRLLINAVQSSRFLTSEQDGELQEGLGRLVSAFQEDDLMSEVYVDQRVPKSYQEVFDTVDTISQAMRRGRKIEFVYTYTGFDGRPHPLEGDNGSQLRVETPLALLFSESNYYVETWASDPWRHGSKLLRSRVDRMINARVSDEPADDTPEVRELRRTTRRRMVEGFEMVNGTSRHVFLRVRADMSNVIFDRFGFAIKFSQFEGEPGSPTSTALTMVRVAESFTFFRWLSAAGSRIVMVEPPSSLILSTSPWKRELTHVNRAQLTDDYRSMTEGYLAYLESAESPYLEVR